jgi:hypothetical protein
MDINPIGSKDVLHGVPTLYKEILGEVIDHVDLAQIMKEELPKVMQYNDNTDIFTASFRNDDHDENQDDDQEDFFKSMIGNAKEGRI